DQIETFFLSVLRGGGVRGLCAMPEVRLLNNKILWRPLLNISRQEIELYAKNNNLPFVEDPTNTDPAYTRNYLRHFWLPEIENKIPHFTRQIESNIKQLQNALAILDEVAADDLAQISPQHGVLDLHKLSKLSAPRRLEVLYLFIKNNQLQMPERHCLETFAQQLFRQPEKYGELNLRDEITTNRYRVGMLIQHLSDNNTTKPLYCFSEKHNGGQECPPYNHTQLTSGLYAQYGFLWAVSNYFSGSLKTEWQTVQKGLPENIIQTLTCRTVTKRDTIRTKIGRKSVWKLLQEKKIPQFIRRQWYVWVDDKNQCVAVANLRCDELLSVVGGKKPVIQNHSRFIVKSI
ncbi:MAG: tRNA lysidine(34) synthetase TilS, partial [Neisseriaceae bacterium]|nr:tRNA lysidine(34) synthetase TilS [Neisseriaceae bacterium]